MQWWGKDKKWTFNLFTIDFSSERIAKRFPSRFRLTYMSNLILKVFTRCKIEHFHIRYDMYDWRKSFASHSEGFWFQRLHNSRSCCLLVIFKLWVAVAIFTAVAGHNSRLPATNDSPALFLKLIEGYIVYAKTHWQANLSKPQKIPRS